MDLESFKKGKSRFGKDVWSPLAITCVDPSLRDFIAEQLRPVLDRFKEDQENIDCGFVIARCRDAVREFEPESGSKWNRAAIHKAERAAERMLHDVFLPAAEENQGPTGRVKVELLERARTICRQIIGPITQQLRGKEIRLLDVGCGDGLVPHLLKTEEKFQEAGNRINHGDLVLADVHSYLDPGVKTAVDSDEYRHINLASDYERFPFETETFNCILLLTVLHHSENPRTVFRACWEVAEPGALILVLESVVEVERRRVENSPSILSHKSVLEDPRQRGRIERFLALGEAGGRDQLIYACFVDWFYNRVLHKDVYVPCNFNRPVEWEEFFRQFAGVTVESTHVEGFDQDSVPEFHTLHVLRKT